MEPGSERGIIFRFASGIWFWNRRNGLAFD
jgi:hypothetical protein